MGLNKTGYLNNVQASGGPVNEGEAVEEKAEPKAPNRKYFKAASPDFN